MFDPDDFKPRRNIGLQTGNGFVALDFDTPARFAKFLLANWSMKDKLVYSATGRGFHSYFRVNGVVPSRKFDGGDLQGENKQVAVAPSTHESGKKYRWLQYPGEFPTIDADDIPALLGEDPVSQQGVPNGEPERPLVETLREKNFYVSDFPKSSTKQGIFAMYWEFAGIELRPGDLMYLCPFHDDKNPSLQIDSWRCLWICFGCNRRGGTKALKALVQKQEDARQENVPVAPYPSSSLGATGTNDYPPEYARSWGTEPTRKDKCMKARKTFRKGGRVKHVLLSCGSWDCATCAPKLRSNRIDVIRLKAGPTAYAFELDEDDKTWGARKKWLERRDASFTTITRTDNSKVLLTDEFIEGSTEVDTRDFQEENIPLTAAKNPVSSSQAWQDPDDKEKKGWVEVTESWLSEEEHDKGIEELDGIITGLGEGVIPAYARTDVWFSDYADWLREREEQVLDAYERRRLAA